ncbi:MAG TPA: helix-turn-helix transcriptional regulator [Candidatus Saccharimonadales bacterium]|nr:helix-turn-helix transcriptional regulator [Candidatus Saccharimonadales bacterium]
MNDLNQTPYRPLGKRLKDLRVRANESLAEASGAVEIDVRELAGFELGKDRPSEDVLLLLISHFGAKDDEAVGLWEMAGYGMDKMTVSHMGNKEIVAVPGGLQDNRIIFTDVVDVTVNNYGVVMNFMQTGPGDSSQPVARVGMSREHANSILKILQVTLAQTDQNQPGRIVSPDNNTKN